MSQSEQLQSGEYESDPYIEQETALKENKFGIWINIFLFLFTFFTTTIAGVFWANKDPYQLDNFPIGLTYSVLILLVISTHEFGHYFAARYHKVPVTLPYYIPFPFIFLNPFGTMGAVIRMKARYYSRKALLDIGAAGPIAGWITSVIILIIGFINLPSINFLYDLHTVTPAMLKTEKYAELAEKSELVRTGYTDKGNGFYALNGRAEPAALRAWFAQNDFNALCFTDSRSRYQYYDLRRLAKDIDTALEAGLNILNLATPPVSADEVYEAVTGKTGWRNETAAQPFDYDMRSLHAALLGGENGYLTTKEQELLEITAFMREWKD